MPLAAGGSQECITAQLFQSASAWEVVWGKWPLWGMQTARQKFTISHKLLPLEH